MGVTKKEGCAISVSGQPAAEPHIDLHANPAAAGLGRGAEDGGALGRFYERQATLKTEKSQSL